jgi:hypothetical protein
MVGSLPQAPTVPAEVGRVVTAVPTVGPGAGDLGAGAVALGAGGIGGAISGEPERQSRGFGRAVASVPSVGSLPVGELPEEEATVTRNSERLSPRPEKGRLGFMERAAPHDVRDDGDAERERRFGIEDKDLFADQRMVSPDVIGGDHADEKR